MKNENCKVSYYLWDQGGNIGFQFFNKTNKDVFLNLEKSYFVLNGIANDYYKNRVYTKSSTIGVAAARRATSASYKYSNIFDINQNERVLEMTSVGTSTSSGQSIAYNEEKIILIPANTAKIITEYTIRTKIYRDCDLYKYPTKKLVKTKTFSKEESPIIFSNRITYSLDNNNPIHFENSFYVSEIANYPEAEILDRRFEEYCGQKSTILIKSFKNESADKFYFRYVKGSDSWRH